MTPIDKAELEIKHLTKRIVIQAENISDLLIEGENLRRQYMHLLLFSCKHIDNFNELYFK